MNYSRFKSLIALLPIVVSAPGTLAAEKPNIIWIIVEDMSCDFGYQGQALVHTPHVDQIQLRGGKLRNVPGWYAQVEAEQNDLVTADQVSLPPYYPDDPVIRKDWRSTATSIIFQVLIHERKV